jgi:hypothetical protein
LRSNIGDVNYDVLDPAETGFGDYYWFSDDVLAALYLAADENVARATGKAILQLALDAALTGESIRTDDLAVDSKNRGDSLLIIAKSWMAQADAEIAAQGFATIVPYAGRVGSYRPATTPSPSTPFGLHEDPNNPGYYIP